MQPYPRTIQNDAGYKTRRNLRIAVSSCFGVLTVAFAVWWLRSYWWNDAVIVPIPGHRAIAVDSGRGYLTTRIFNYAGAPSSQGPKFSKQSTAINVTNVSGQATNSRFALPYRFMWHFGGLTQPFWAPFIACLCVAVIPWLRQLTMSKSFSLRALFIATTLLAVVLGLAMWAVR